MLEEYDPLIIFNDKISTVHDRIQQKTNQARLFLNELFSQEQKPYIKKKTLRGLPCKTRFI